MNKKDCVVLGTRPDIIKFAPLIKKIDPFIIHTGQHQGLADSMFKVFNIIPDVNLRTMAERQSLSVFFSKCIRRMDKVIRKNDFEKIWVHGDTSSALAGALVANINQIQLIHNEAGLRTHDKKNPYPEEIFRTLIDSMSDIMFAPTMRAKRNLRNENVKGDMYYVGNTIVDSINMIKERIPKGRPIPKKYVLATVHRRESFGDDLYEIFSALKELSKEIKVIIPAHPNPNVQKIIKEVDLKVVEPMNYLKFLWYLKHCEYVVSDSGGLQEEIPSFKKKIIVLRKTTERQEIIEKGYGILIDKMEKNYILNKIKEFSKKEIDIEPNVFGQNVSNKIVRIMKTYETTENKIADLTELKSFNLLQKIASK